MVGDRRRLDSVKTGVVIAVALCKIFASEWPSERYGRLLVNDAVLELVRRADAPEAVQKAWQSGLDDFRRRRAQYLLYK